MIRVYDFRLAQIRFDGSCAILAAPINIDVERLKNSPRRDESTVLSSTINQRCDNASVLTYYQSFDELPIRKRTMSTDRPT